MDYTPKNRHEQYLDAIRTNDTTDLPTPITREEKYLSEIAMNSGGGGEDYSVKYTEQDLTTEQQAQARENIGAAASADIPTDAVKYSAQTLTAAQKTQARTNIGAAASDDNKLRLGQIYTIWQYSSDTSSYIYVIGFYNVFKHINYSITEINFSTDAATSMSKYIYRTIIVGDFMAFRESNSSKTVYVKPTSAFIGTKICVENGYYMFSNCNDLKDLDISMFDTSECKDMTQMFYGCTALKTLDLSSFDMTNVIAYDKMFGEESHWAGITTLKTPKINPHDDIPLPITLYSQDGTAYTNLPVTTGTSIELRKSWT